MAAINDLIGQIENAELKEHIRKKLDKIVENSSHAGRFRQVKL